jgi:L-lactate utilization protein LutC
MKAKTFENLIRKVVREEIDYALRREIKSLKEDLRDELKPTITEHTERLVEVPKSSLKEKIMGKKPIKKSFKKQNYTGNSALNDLLNETAAGDTNLDSNNSPVSLAQPFSSGAPLPIDTTGMPESVANAVTRDYSGLMKAINKQKEL